MTSPNSDQAAILKQRQKLMQTARGFRAAKILMTCVEMGVFQAVAQGARTAEQIASTIGADVRGTELLLNAAVPLGWLEKKENRFFNTTVTQTFLVPGGPAFFVETLKLESAFYRRWDYLAKAVKTGKRPDENMADEQPQDWVRRFQQALYDMARPIAPWVAEALARRYPRLQATVYELPRVVPVTREIINREGMSERVLVQEGDFQRGGLGRDFDDLLLFGVLNGEPPEGRPALIRKAFAALKPGGRLYLRDFVLDPDRAGPLDAAVFALQMLLSTEAGGLNTRDEWAEWLSAAGFGPMTEIPLPDWIGVSLNVAKKPNHLL